MISSGIMRLQLVNNCDCIMLSTFYRSKILGGFVLEKEREKLLKRFLNSIEITFGNLNLLNQAFFHSSYINECQDRICDNEKLEFLGDSVLSLVTVEFLYLKYQNKSEGELSRLKSLLVSANTLCEFAHQIHLSEYLLLGKGETKSGGQQRPSLLADTFEAVLGALYLDSGIDTVREFIIPLLDEYIDKIERCEHSKDYKTALQLYVQQKYKSVPIYKTVKESGPDHAKTFYIHVFVNDTLCGTGKGQNKKNAQQEAAKDAIVRLGFE